MRFFPKLNVGAASRGDHAQNVQLNPVGAASRGDYAQNVQRYNVKVLAECRESAWMRLATVSALHMVQRASPRDAAPTGDFNEFF